MKLNLEGREIEIQRGESILDAIGKLGIESDSLLDRPLAAQMGGEVFNLKYTPHKESNITLLRYNDLEGQAVYERTLLFVFIMAMRKLFPKARVYVRYSKS